MPDDPYTDPFHPPAVPVEVFCLHCGQEYESWRIEWRQVLCDDGKVHGFWCCPVPGCDGRGFGCDILPTDPDYQDERGGWVSFDDEEEPDEFDESDAWEEEPFDCGNGEGTGRDDGISF